jgi:hypothetical protein
MALGWKWKVLDPKDKSWTLPKFIQYVNIQMSKLTDALATLFSSIESVNTFAGGATAPSIYGSNTWLTNNPVPTSITNFLDGAAGKTITVWAGDANTTIKNNANIRTKTGADIVMTANDVRTFVTKDGLLWRET